MKINLSLSSYYDRYLSISNKKMIEVNEEKLNIHRLLSILQIPESEVGFVMVNGIRCNPDYLLHESDTVKILPALIGG